MDIVVISDVREAAARREGAFVPEPGIYGIAFSNDTMTVSSDADELTVWITSNPPSDQPYTEEFSDGHEEVVSVGVGYDGGGIKYYVIAVATEHCYYNGKEWITDHRKEYFASFAN